MVTSQRRRTPEEIFKAVEEKIDRARLRGAVHLNLGERRRSLRRIPSLVGLTRLKSIKAPWTGITDLTALADVPQLESLDLSGTPVWDLTPLKAAKSLKVLTLDYSSVVDLSPLRDLTNLTNLSLWGSQVADLSALAELINLSSLDVAHTRVSDLSPLRGCKRLQSLDIRSTRVSSLSFAYDVRGLTGLSCVSTNIETLAPLAGLHLRTLDIESTKIADLSPLEGMSTLERLDVAHTPVAEIGALKSFYKLEWLRLDGSKVSDLSPLLNLKTLALPPRPYACGLSFGNCPIADPEIRKIRDLKGAAYAEKSEAVINYLRRLNGLEPFKEYDPQAATASVDGGSNLLPLDNVPSPFSFDLSPTGTVVLSTSAANWPTFSNSTSVVEHTNRLDACRTLGSDLVSDFESGRYQAREEYKDGLERYLERLPEKPGGGNILLADAEARTLRNLFAAEADILSIAFASKLKTFLEQHIGLRVFYPDIAKFYRDVQTGKLEQELPLDAIEGFVRGIQDSTPEIFDRSVAATIEGSADDAQQSFDVPELGSQNVASSSVPMPPRDPLGELDPKVSSDFTFAGAANGIWRTFLQGEKIYKAFEGWRLAGENLQPHVARILHWLAQAVSSGGGPPTLPPTIGV
jgi:hypothetical protein